VLVLRGPTFGKSWASYQNVLGANLLNPCHQRSINLKSKRNTAGKH